MNDLYYEHLVKRKKSMKNQMPVYGMAVLTLLCAAVGILLIPIALPLALVLGVGTYFVSYMTNVEYEYLFVNGDMDIDKIISQSRRKRVKSIKLEEVELMAPLDSHRLDHYNQKQNLRTLDYSSGIADHQRFAMIAKDDKGMCRMILEPDENLAKTMKNCSPSKIFLD